MIFVGLDEEQKRREILKYARESKIKNIIVFSDEAFFMDLPPFHKIRQIGYKEIIMYRTFYPLLEEVDESCLLVMNEMMRDRNRGCLTYNCLAKFTNQTPHRLVFEYVPIVEERKDILILIDFATSQRYKGQSVADISLQEQEIYCVRRHFEMPIIPVCVPDGAIVEYEKKKESLFENIGSKDPDTIPRELHVWTGKYKKRFIAPEKKYIARNQRYKLQNVTTYSMAKRDCDYTLIDLYLSRKPFNDFLRRTRQTCFPYLSTGFKVDDVYIGLFEAWRKEVDAIYAETGIYAEDG